MRHLTLIGTLIAALASFSGAPAVAGGHTASLTYMGGTIRHNLCFAPAVLENVCVAWAPGQPGQLFGPCIKYQLQCVTPAQIH